MLLLLTSAFLFYQRNRKTEALPWLKDSQTWCPEKSLVPKCVGNDFNQSGHVLMKAFYNLLAFEVPQFSDFVKPFC